MLDLTRTWAVMAKELVQLTRDRLTYAMILMLPIVQLLLFGYAVNDDPRHLPTAVLAIDNGTFSRSVVRAMENSTYFDVTLMARSQAELDQAMERGEVQFGVIIPGDFSDRVVRGDSAVVLVEADASDPSATSGALAALQGLPDGALARDLTGPLANRGNGAPPFSVVTQARYNPEQISAYSVVPGLLGVILSMTLVMMTSLAMARERERGTMESLLATPVRPLEVMVGKLAPYVIVGLLQAAVILLLARTLFQVPMNGGWLALAVGLLLFIVGSLALGFLISTLAKTQLQAMQMSFFYVLPSILLSGFVFPFRGMPDWAQALGTLVPVTHFLRVVRGSLLKGVGLENAWGSLSALIVFVVVVGSLAILRYRTTLD
ncbi:mannose-1-phosphate guanyltransferase [Caulobacter henricii]|uniref:Mannose-1-phosphate guanyltransferase n=2 Tax=Caulobacter henricii TaxID=69395 RepID=A0A0P0NYF1_9CAUL|nr:ABC transporter permease [Caulobacter henricii]ALL13149.1 mannose-1-phosphate guanyltransferase [Caulobacter henricii]